MSLNPAPGPASPARRMGSRPQALPAALLPMNATPASLARELELPAPLIPKKQMEQLSRFPPISTPTPALSTSARVECQHTPLVMPAPPAGLPPVPAMSRNPAPGPAPPVRRMASRPQALPAGLLPINVMPQRCAPAHPQDVPRISINPTAPLVTTVMPAPRPILARAARVRDPIQRPVRPRTSVMMSASAIPLPALVPIRQKPTVLHVVAMTICAPRTFVKEAPATTHHSLPEPAVPVTASFAMVMRSAMEQGSAPPDTEPILVRMMGSIVPKPARRESLGRLINVIR